MTRGERQQEELEEEKEEFEVDDDEDIRESKRSRWWRRFSAVFGSESIGSSGIGIESNGGGGGRRRGGLDRFVIRPDNWWYVVWTHFILLWAVYSSFFTPLEFGFFRGLPENLFLLDSAGQIVFFVDIFVRFFVAYPDFLAHRIVSDRKLIALRYLKSRFLVDLLGCMPWDAIYKASGKQEPVRYLLWIRLSRACRVTEFFEKLEKDIRINYLGTRIVKLFVVELYCTHTAACIFYYLATTLPPSKEGYTWIGSLKMGDYSYSHFREIDLWKRYVTSLYFAVVTMATVGYGEIHAVNAREMIFIMIYVSFDMILGAYLLGNMAALIVKGSKTEKFRDQVTDLIKYMNRNKLDKHISKEIKSHLRLQYDRSYAKSDVLQDIPSSIRCKISQNLYEPFIKKVPLFRGCSMGFIKQIASRVNEEFFLPGEVILEQGNVIDQLYVVCHGELEEVDEGEDDESEELVRRLETYSSFGEISFLCNSPQPYTVLVRELCRVLRLDKQSFREILEIYLLDGRTILNNLLEGKDSNLQNKLQGSDVSMLIGKHEFELAMRVNCAAHDGDFFQLKRLIRAGADPKRIDYDGRSPLHFSASKGYKDITRFLIEQGVQVNLLDKFGNSPLFEAVKNGHDQVASLLVEAGATLGIDDTGGFLCSTVARRDLDLLARVLANDIDPNARNYDHRTPLHIAAAEGLYLISEVLLKAGASVLLRDRWGNTPLDESRINGNKNLIKLLDVARTSQLSTFSGSYKNLQVSDETIRKKCTVFGFHPFKPKEEREDGVVLWVAPTIEELIKAAMEELKCPNASSILSENGGKILDPAMIANNDKLFLI